MTKGTKYALTFSLFACIAFASGCATVRTRQMEVTAYCGCGTCCEWHRGSWKYLRLNVWNRYVNSGKQKGQVYTGLTASGTRPKEPYPGLFSMDSIIHPWMGPIRIIFFPWLLVPRDGTIAADTKFYPFGTRMNISGYGWGVVEDRGSAIKGPDRLDVYFKSHDKALTWGRRRVSVRIEK